MAEMPRPRPPHLQREKSRHGKLVWYVRVGKGPRVRLSADFGTEEFDAEYVAAVNGKPLPASEGEKKKAATKGSLQWLYDEYRKSGEWLALSRATHKQRENIFRPMMETSGHERATAIQKADIIAGRERRAHTPAQSRNFLDAVRGLFRWALGADHIKVDPTAGVKNPKKKQGPGFPAWTEADVEAYQRRWPIGTRQRVWLDVLLYTGPRRGDAAELGDKDCRTVTQLAPDEHGNMVPKQVRILQFTTEKSGETVEVTIPILDVLERTLAAGPVGKDTWICGLKGGSLVKEAFGNMFSEAAREAGIRKSAHGVRKIAAMTAALNGATVPELDALFGWEGGRMASLYTKAADRVRLGAAGAIKLDGKRTSPPAPAEEVRAAAAKAQ
jgi:integrase